MISILLIYPNFQKAEKIVSLATDFVSLCGASKMHAR
jgi:hypothetical protein